MASFRRAADWVRGNPVHAGLLAISVGATAAAVALSFRRPRGLFRASSVRFDEGRTVAPELQAIVDAIRRTRAEGLLTEEEALAVNADFADLARSQHAAEGSRPALSRATVAAVLRRIGISDEQLINRIFAAWDDERAGALDLRAFLHALVLALHGSTRDKLSACFTIADINGDGYVSRDDLARFLGDVHAFAGHARTPQAVRSQVAAMFDSRRAQRMLAGGRVSVSCRGGGPSLAIELPPGHPGLTRDEFVELAATSDFHVGDTLKDWLDAMTKQFALAMEPTADALAREGRPGDDE